MGGWVQPDDVVVTRPATVRWVGPLNGYAIERYPADPGNPATDQAAHDCAWAHVRAGQGNVVQFWRATDGYACEPIAGDVTGGMSSGNGSENGGLAWVGDYTRYFVAGAFGSMPGDVDSIQMDMTQAVADFDLDDVWNPAQYAPSGAEQESSVVELVDSVLRLDAPTFSGTQPWQMRARLCPGGDPDLVPEPRGWLMPDEAILLGDLIATIDYPGAGPYTGLPLMARGLVVEDLAPNLHLYLHLASSNWYDNVAPTQASPGDPAQGWREFRFAYVKPQLTVTLRPPRYRTTERTPLRGRQRASGVTGELPMRGRAGTPYGLRGTQESNR